MGEILRAVQLTAAQQQQIHQIMSTAHTQTAPQMAQMKALQQQLDTALFGSATVTEAQLMPLEQQKETLRQQLDVVHLQTEVAIRNLLTPAQLTQAASIQTRLASLHQQEHAIAAPTE